MQTIHKYPLKGVATQNITTPAGPKLLHLAVQNGVPCLWFLVDPGREYEVEWQIRVYGTGEIVPDFESLNTFFGTILLHDGALVYHVFGSIVEARKLG